MSDTRRAVTPKAGQVWQKTGTDRRVLIEDTDHRWAYARRTETGDVERIDLFTFNRPGKNSWIYVEEQTA